MTMVIRKKLNLQNLKKSSVPKHQKIWEKATRIMNEGYSTPDLSPTEIEIMAEQFKEHGLRANVTINGDITVRSKCDTWVVVNEGRYYALYHELIDARSKKRHAYHIQDVFYDLDFLFASIVAHDSYKMNIYNYNTIDDSQDLIKGLSIFAHGTVETMEFTF